MPEPAQIRFEERAQIGRAVFEHRHAIEAEAEREALVALRIDAAHFQHTRMHHARAAELQPVIAGAEFDRAAGTVAIDVPLDARLGERKEGWPRAQRNAGYLEEGGTKLLHHPFE